MSMLVTRDQLLQELEGLGFHFVHFPKRERFTHKQWALLSKEAKKQAYLPKEQAMNGIRNLRKFFDFTRKIEQITEEDMVPILAELWADCVLVPVRDAAGYALSQIKTKAAYEALQTWMEDSDSLSTIRAIKSMFEQDPFHAFDRLIGYFSKERMQQPGGSVIPKQVLTIFIPSDIMIAADETRAQKRDEPARSWLSQDSRWMELCIHLRQDHQLGVLARQILRNIDSKLVKALLEQVRHQEQTPHIQKRFKVKGDLLSRYQQGEHILVWEELRAISWVEGDFRQEAFAVSQETMKRVSRGVSLLAQRLEAQGWKGLNRSFHELPSGKEENIIRKMEQITKAPCPPSLQAFWEIVGGIHFVWDYRQKENPPMLILNIALDEMDPLWVDAASTIPRLFEEWESREVPIDPELGEPFFLDLAPDFLHKIDVSGGAPYGIELPFWGADPLFINEEHHLPFVDYLRLCMRWGGFPLLENEQHRFDIRFFVQKLTKDIEPF